MEDIVVAGSGTAARLSGEVLAVAGFRVGSEASGGTGRCPLILGQSAEAFVTAWQAVESGRHVLLAHPAALSPGQLATILAARAPRQALFIWGERRFHPAYRLVAGLVQAGDATWQPRYLRNTTYSAERPTTALMRWRTIESLALVFDLLGASPASVSASGAPNVGCGAPDFYSLSLDLTTTTAFLSVALGEGTERRETVLAAPARKAYIDEMNQTVPVRLVDDDPPTDPGGAARWVSCPSPSPAELARQQCLAFLEATERPALAATETDTWQRALAAWRAAEASLSAGSARVDVREPAASGLRVITGGGQGAPSTSPRLRTLPG